MEKYPRFITIEIMDICNLRCSHCFIENWDNHDGFMKYDFFEKIVERLSETIKHAQSFDFSCVEALFHKRLFDMFDSVKSINPNMYLHVNTNGMLLTKEKIQKL